MLLKKCLKLQSQTNSIVRPIIYYHFSTSVAHKLLDDNVRRQTVDTKKKRIPIIESKRPEFNYYGKDYGKNEDIPCVSTGWSHKKSKDDYFIVRANEAKQPISEKKLKVVQFDELGLHTDILEVLAKTGITNPSEIQIKGIPAILQGFNTQLAAETGCGKTLAYLLPIIQQIMQKKKENPNRDGFNKPLAIIVTPIRDLANQISLVAESICEPLGINVDCIVGGHTKRLIMNPKVKEVDLMVGTIGAMSKLINTGIYKVEDVNHVVLDEADTLLDDSFSDKLVETMTKFPFQYKKSDSHQGCQLTIVSATMPTELPEVISKFLDPTSIKKVVTKNMHKVLPHVEQRFLRLRQSQKPLELLKLVKDDVNKNRPVMIFSNKTPTCDWISMFLKENKVDCVHINGNMPVDVKLGEYEKFRDGKVNVLSCTDIASRGLDTIRTEHIINYEFPKFIADYIHRCGRTGRLGSSNNCKITNFIASPLEVFLVQKIELSLRRKRDLPSVDANITKLIGEYLSKKEEKLAMGILSSQ